MAGNKFGKQFTISTFGESHGPAMGVVIDGCPPLISLDNTDIQTELNKRRPGQSSITTSRKEPDTVEILSGVFEGKTTGAPVSLLIRNQNQRSKDYNKLKSLFRPGHADYTYMKKYGIRDHRGGGRSSGRETSARVAAGAVAKKILASQGITVQGYTLAIAGIYAEEIDYSFIELNPLRSPDRNKFKEMISKIEESKDRGDSLGGIVEAVVKNCTPGLGDPVFDKLDAVIAHALMSLGAVKGVEFGAGFSVAGMTGSECNDELYVDGTSVRTLTNNAGGILGGISNGEDIVVRVAVKPTASIIKTQRSVNTDYVQENISVEGRHDPCICPRLVPVVESMIALSLVDALIAHKGISGF